MILGTGIDLIEISRIASAIRNERFVERVYTSAEIQESKRASHRLAGFFAAKEALLKAMGTGLTDFSWQEIEIRHNDLGAPYYLVREKVQAYLEQKGVRKIHLSISHCKEYAVAQTILEGEAPQ